MKVLSGVSVVLAEDEFLIAIDAEAMRRDLGAATVEVVGTCDAARKRIGERHFDAAVLDAN